MHLGRQRLHADADEWGERVVSHAASNRLRAGHRVTIFLRVGPHAITVLIVDPEVLDGFSLELVAHARVDGPGETYVSLVALRQPNHLGQRLRLRRVFLHCPARDLAELRYGVGGEELGPAVHGMNGLPSA